MGLFDIFKTKGNTPIQQLNWYTIRSANQLTELDRLSKNKLMVIFKHSTSCPISKMAFKRFQKEADFDTEQVDLFYVGVIDDREVSNAIASHYGVMHQSPQLIIIKEGDVIHHASHSAIVPSSVNRFL
jgi:bacillithiol system protein YtxJ